MDDEILNKDIGSINSLELRIESARYFGADVKNAIEILDLARMKLTGRDLDGAVKESERGQEVLNGSLVELVAVKLQQVRAMHTKANDIGALTEKATAMMENVTFAREDAQIERSLFYLQLAREELQRTMGQHQRVSKALEAAERKVRAIFGGPDPRKDDMLDSIEEAKLQLELYDYAEALETVKKVISAAISIEEEFKEEAGKIWGGTETSIQNEFDKFIGASKPNAQGEKEHEQPSIQTTIGAGSSPNETASDIELTGSNDTSMGSSSTSNISGPIDQSNGVLSPPSPSLNMISTEDSDKEPILLEFAQIKGMGYALSLMLYESGYTSKNKLAIISKEELTSIKGIGNQLATNILSWARDD